MLPRFFQNNFSPERFRSSKDFFQKMFSTFEFKFLIYSAPSSVLNENGGGTRLDCRISARVMSCATTWAFYVTTTRLIMKATREG